MHVQCLGKSRSWRKKPTGFSLVELLVVISVIAVIAAIAISSVKGIIENGAKSTARRNAQSIAQVAAAAQAAGNSTIEAAANLSDAIDIVYDGAQGQGEFTDMEFGISQLGIEDLAQAKGYLEFSNGRILYNPNF